MSGSGLAERAANRVAAWQPRLSREHPPFIVVPFPSNDLGPIDRADPSLWL